MDLHLQDKVALVTVASDGIGYAIARRLLVEGAQVIVCDSNRQKIDDAAARLTADLGPDTAVYAEKVDITKRHIIKRMVAKIEKRFDTVDILVANTAPPPTGTFKNIDMKTWRQAVRTILMSTLYLAELLLPRMQKSSHPTVLTITDLTAKQPLHNLILSNVLRPAVWGLTKTLSQEFGPMGVRCNALLPGWIITPHLDDMIYMLADKNDLLPEHQAVELVSQIPLGRFGSPAEVATTAAFLVSPAAGYINGTILSVDGGAYVGLL